MHPSHLKLTNKYLFAISISHRWHAEDTPLSKNLTNSFFLLTFFFFIRNEWLLARKEFF